jgi:hypothetical protein
MLALDVDTFHQGILRQLWALQNFANPANAAPKINQNMIVRCAHWDITPPRPNVSKPHLLQANGISYRQGAGHGVAGASPDIYILPILAQIDLQRYSGALENQ